MPRIRFYNRRSRHEHPPQHHLWRLPAEGRGKPASSRLRDRGSSEGVAAAHSESRRRTTLRSSGPPTAPCLTARRRLRVDRLPLLAQEVMDGAPALSAERALRRIEPSGTFLGRPVASARARGSGRMSPVRSEARQCDRPSLARGAFHRRRPTRAPFRDPTRFGCRRWPAGQPPHVFTGVREHRLDPCSPALRGRLQGRMRLFDFCRWMLQRARPGTVRTSRTAGSRPGRLPRDRKSPFDRGNRRRFTGSGVENTASRHSPS
jgi:hypothetical protein